MFSLNNFEHRVIAANHPEQLRDILCLLFEEMSMRHTGIHDEPTGFEDVTDEDLHHAFYRTANQMIIMWCRLQEQLVNIRRVCMVMFWDVSLLNAP